MRILFFCILSLIIYRSILSKCLNRQCDDNDPDCVYEEDTECCESCTDPCLETCTTSRCRTRTCRNNCLTTCQKRSPCPTRTRTNCNKENCQKRRCPPSPEPITPLPELLVPLQKNEEPIIIELPEQQQQVVVPNITTNNLVNLTTHINLNNIVHNFNNITTPIFVNTTNINNIAIINNGTRGQYTSPILHPSPPIIINMNTTNSNSDSIYVNRSDNQLPCCKIMGQKECYFDDNGKPKCRQHRYNICGPMCYSPVITQIDNTYHQYASGCQNNPPYIPCTPTFINTPPPPSPPQFIYPRPTQIITPRPTPPTDIPIACYFCYSCNSNNPNDCWQSPNCPYACRQLLQQSQTNCASNQRGTTC